MANRIFPVVMGNWVWHVVIFYFIFFFYINDYWGCSNHTWCSSTIFSPVLIKIQFWAWLRPRLWIAKSFWTCLLAGWRGGFSLIGSMWSHARNWIVDCYTVSTVRTGIQVCFMFSKLILWCDNFYSLLISYTHTHIVYLCPISRPFLIIIFNAFSIVRYIISQLGSVGRECSVLSVQKYRE